MSNISLTVLTINTKTYEIKKQKDIKQIRAKETCLSTTSILAISKVLHKHLTLNSSRF